MNSKTWKMSRRTVLKGLGAAMGLPWLEAMGPLASVAAPVASAKAPVRLAVLYMPNGVNPRTWTPEGMGRDFKLTSVMEPLEPLRDDLLIFTNLWNAAADTGDGHYVKTGGFLTGTTITRTTGNDLRSGGMSMDQVAARAIGNMTALPSLELGIEPPHTGVDTNVGYTQLYGAHISWSTPVTPVSKEINPRMAFDRIFRSQIGGKPGRYERDRSVIDAVREDARRLEARLGQDDRQKLNEYFDSVRSVEKRIEFDARRQSAEIQEDPLAREAVAELGRRIDLYGDPRKVSERTGNHTGHVQLMLDIIALAFWTDSTRVSTFMFGNAVSGRSFTFLEGVTDGHHPISHHENKADKLEQFRRINRWHIEQYAYLLKKLKSIREGDSNVLDNSMILLGAGMRDGNAHDPHNLPLLVAGRAGGAWATGRHLKYAANTPLCNLYQGMLKRMGAPVDHFGDSTGELPGLNDPAFSQA